MLKKPVQQENLRKLCEFLRIIKTLFSPQVTQFFKKKQQKIQEIALVDNLFAGRRENTLSPL